MSEKIIEPENMFTEKDLKKLGFERNYITIEESGADAPFTYYIFEMNGTFLISGEFEKDTKTTTVELFEGNRPLSREFVEACVKEFKLK